MEQALSVPAGMAKRSDTSGGILCPVKVVGAIIGIGLLPGKRNHDSLCSMEALYGAGAFPLYLGCLSNIPPGVAVVGVSFDEFLTGDLQLVKCSKGEAFSAFIQIFLPEIFQEGRVAGMLFQSEQ